MWHPLDIRRNATTTTGPDPLSRAKAEVTSGGRPRLQPCHQPRRLLEISIAPSCSRSCDGLRGIARELNFRGARRDTR